MVASLSLVVRQGSITFSSKGNVLFIEGCWSTFAVKSIAKVVASLRSILRTVSFAVAPTVYTAHVGRFALNYNESV